MKIKQIAFTGYPVTDMARARKFYEGVLGLTASREFGEAFVEYDLGEGTFSLGCMGDQWKPSSDGPSLAFEVEDFDAAIQELKKAETPITMGPMESPVCWMALVRDPDGNTLCIHRSKGA